MFKKLKNESGVVLIVCLSILFMLALIGIASITTSNTDMDIADNEYKTTGAFYAAESGLERAAASITTSYRHPAKPVAGGYRIGIKLCLFFQNHRRWSGGPYRIKRRGLRGIIRHGQNLYHKLPGP